jgi:hypothetical protein
MKVFRLACCAGTLLATMALGLAGCSSDEEKPAGTAGTGGTGGAVDCNTPAGVAQCKARGAAQGTCAAITDCGCDNCCVELSDCDIDPGCMNILNCALSTGCRGIACYQAATCMQVIDDNGGPTGVPAGVATILSECTTAAACPSAC